MWLKYCERIWCVSYLDEEWTLMGFSALLFYAYSWSSRRRTRWSVSSPLIQWIANTFIFNDTLKVRENLKKWKKLHVEMKNMLASHAKNGISSWRSHQVRETISNIQTHSNPNVRNIFSFWFYPIRVYQPNKMKNNDRNRRCRRRCCCFALFSIAIQFRYFSNIFCVYH